MLNLVNLSTYKKTEKNRKRIPRAAVGYPEE